MAPHSTIVIAQASPQTEAPARRSRKRSEARSQKEPTAGQMAARETLLGLTEGTSTYSQDGSAVTRETSRRLVDQSI